MVPDLKVEGLNAEGEVSKGTVQVDDASDQDITIILYATRPPRPQLSGVTFPAISILAGKSFNNRFHHSIQNNDEFITSGHIKIKLYICAP